MIRNEIRVTVTGAAGHIGYALLFRIGSGEMFGKETVVHLNLLEIEAALPALTGVVMELEDCAFPLLKSICATAEPKEAFKEADWALLVGSIPRKEGMERGDLLKINGKIFIVQGNALSDYAKPTCKVLVIGNPCNTNAYIAKTSCPNIPQDNFFAMTMLDQHRAYSLLAKKAGAAVSDVKNVAIWGNHSATQYPDFYHAVIAGKPVLEIIRDERWLQTDFMETIQKRGAAVIKARGHSSAASAANAIMDTVRKLISPTREGEYFSLAVSSDGSYGVEQGLVFSFPVRSNGQNCEIVKGIKHNIFGQDKIAVTLKELISEKEAVREML